MQKFRFTKEVFLEVFEEIRETLTKPKRSTSVPPLLRFAAALSFYASGSYQHNVWHERLGQKTVGRCIHEVTAAVEQHICPKWIVFPQTLEARQAVKVQFYNKFGLPGIIGCIDCTHVIMVSPHISEHLFVDRLRKHSLNVQLVSFYFSLTRYLYVFILKKFFKSYEGVRL